MRNNWFHIAPGKPRNKVTKKPSVSKTVAKKSMTKKYVTKKQVSTKTITYKVTSVVPLGPYPAQKAHLVESTLKKDPSVKVSGLRKSGKGYSLSVTAVSYQKYPYGVTPSQIIAHMKQAHPDVKVSAVKVTGK